MRHFAILIAFLLGFAPALTAETLRVATWEVDGFETVSPETPPSEADVKRLRQMAGQLKPLDAEVVVLHGLTDRQLAKRLTSFLKPATYHVALYSTFKKGGTGTNNVVIGPSITVLSRRQPFAARAMEWKNTGQIDLPGGFAFAGFSAGTNALCLYVAHLPSDPGAAYGETDTAATTRKRELAGQYLAHHANWLGSTLTNQLASFFITGDFAVDPRAARAESVVRVLQQAGFKGAFPTFPAPKKQAQSSEETDPPVVPMLTALLARNGDFTTAPQVLTRKPFGQPIVAYDMVTSSPAPAPAPASTAASAPSGPVPAKVVELDQSLVWLWVGGIAALSMTILFAVWLVRRTNPNPKTFGRPGDNAVVLDVSSFSESRRRPGVPPPPGASYSGSTTDAANAQAALWHARAMQAEQRANHAVAAARAGLMPHLGRLMRERLFAWLTSQRSQLIHSHEVGTQQVLELEERLEKIQGQFQDRLRTREERILELEREILTKEKVIRDLLRAQVRMANDSPSQ